MSDVAQGPGWWIASDGKWYAPELHPSRRNDPVGATAGSSGSIAQRLALGGTADANHVGPSFPDLFEKAVQGSSLADSVKWKATDETGRPVRTGAPSTAGQTVGASSAPSNGSSKKRWRKGS